MANAENLNPVDSKMGGDDVDKRRKATAEDFIFGKIIGEGSFSTVYLAKEIATGREFAMKVLQKQQMIKEKKAEYVMREKKVLEKLGQKGHPFFVRLYATFQDATRLFFVLSYEPNGELLDYIRRLSAFDLNSTKFYAAEIVLALEHLHSLGIVHRDLKPENILLSKEMHIRITDFGSSRMLGEETAKSADTLSPQTAERPAGAGNRRSSFVGTAQYVSPEVLQSKKVTKSCDLWALGCIIYQLTSGEHPFRGTNDYQIFNKIMKLEYDFPEGFDVTTRDLVDRLLKLEAEERLGSDATGGYLALKAHQFFERTDWENLHKTEPPRLVPYLPALSDHNEALWSEIGTGGLDDHHMVRLIGLGLNEGSLRVDEDVEPMGDADFPYPELLLAAEEKKRLIAKQAIENKFHKFVEGNLIVHQGFLDKRKGLFARRRMFLMTEGPHLYYVDAANMVLKGEVPWSRSVRPEAKNFKVFFVHTPKRTYYLEDPAGYGQVWCDKIQALWRHYYGPRNPKFNR